MVDQFHSVCGRKKLEVSAENNKVIVFKRKGVKMVNFGNPYRVTG